MEGLPRKSRRSISTLLIEKPIGDWRVGECNLLAVMAGLWATVLLFGTPRLFGQESKFAEGSCDQLLQEDESAIEIESEVDQDAPSESKQDRGDQGDDESVIPAPKKKYMGRRIAPTMGFAHAGWLTRSERQQEEDTQQAIENLGLKPGMIVCDMGCGNGYYSLEIAKRVGPDGKVLAVDIQQEMLHLLHLRAEESQVKNIQTILGTVVDPQLPKESIDLLLMVDVYHEFSHPEEMLAKIRDSLSPKGRVALIEFRAEDPRVPILAVHKMTKRQILREFKANGFRLVEQYDGLPWQHLMFFEKDESSHKR